MPSYKLTYFNNRGKAEVIRLLFTLAGQDFEDVRIATEEWPTFKPKTPLGQIPVLQIDNGEMIPQSFAIASYLARQFGLNGSNTKDTLTVDIVFHIMDDLLAPLGNAIFSDNDETTKTQLIKEFYDKTASPFLRVLENMLIRNGGEDGFFVGDKISLADLVVFAGLDRGFEKRSDILELFPKLVKLMDRVASEPKIAEYLAKRSKTLF